MQRNIKAFHAKALRKGKEQVLVPQFFLVFF